MNQLELHKKIGEFFKADPKSADVKAAQDLLVNEDAKRFFFAQANESWIDWLWKNGFLDAIKKKADNPDRISYRLPELEYLTRIAPKAPIIVAAIILDKGTATTADNFNPEVIDRFLWIISLIPAEQIAELTKKIRDEKWIYLVRGFGKTGYEFTKIVDKLVEKNESNALLEFAQAMLIVRNKTEIAEKNNRFNNDSPFYVGDLGVSGIFEAIARIELSHAEQALEVTTGAMAEIIKTAEPDSSGTFEYDELFSLFDVDFFSLEVAGKRGLSYREDIKNLAATIKTLAKRTIGTQCADANEAKKLFSYIDKLPSSRSMWRLKLFVMSQCPEVFKEELKNAFFKLFEVKNYYDIEGGTEYKKALKVAFPHLEDSDQRAYVSAVLKYFSEMDKNSPDQAWHKRTGWEILSTISPYLKGDEPKQCEEVFGKKCDESYEPKPSIGEMHSGAISAKSPVVLGDYTIEQIIEKLKTEWTQEKFKEQFKDDDFFNPRGVEGLGDALREDIKKRKDKYLENFAAFFDRNAIAPQYVYSLLRGIEEMIRNQQPLTLQEIKQVIGLFEAVRAEGEKTPFVKSDDKSWLADWITVHKIMADLLLEILQNKEIKVGGYKVYREQFKDLITYLLTIKDSPSKEHEKPEYGEPYHVAINSVRGRAYEAFVVFVENDGKVLAGDAQSIFKKTLLDDSLAVRFVVGRYLASFYFRDKNFITGLFPEIFPKDDPSKKDIYLAAWEGYLSNTLYDKLFAALSDYYSHAIALDPKEYTERKYSKGLDEALAIHLALAFVYLGLGFDDPLFVQFWNVNNIIRHEEFVSFIGRSCLTRDSAGDDSTNESKIDKGKLIKFWEWALANVSEPKVLSGFGFWVNPNLDKEVLDDGVVIEKMAETLKKSGGIINWDSGLLRRLPLLAKKNKKATFEIIINYLLDANGSINQNRRVPLLYQAEIRDALGIIYGGGDEVLRQGVVDLVNTLIEKGSSTFWDLKEIFKDGEAIG
jgi:hypothetical protein